MGFIYSYLDIQVGTNGHNKLNVVAVIKVERLLWTIMKVH